jgi:hypothetical protein
MNIPKNSSKFTEYWGIIWILKKSFLISVVKWKFYFLEIEPKGLNIVG